MCHKQFCFLSCQVHVNLSFDLVTRLQLLQLTENSEEGNTRIKTKRLLHCGAVSVGIAERM
jgi:hypothetical protein